MTKSRMERKTEGFEKVKTQADNPDGFAMEMKYVAPFYRYSRFSLAKAKWIHGVLEILKILFLLAGYTQYSACNLYSYSGRLAVAALAPELFCVLGILFFLFSPQLLHLPKYREVKNLICIGSGASGAALGASALGCCLYTVSAETQDILPELITIFFYALATAVGILLSCLQKKGCYEKCQKVERI